MKAWARLQFKHSGVRFVDYGQHEFLTARRIPGPLAAAASLGPALSPRGSAAAHAAALDALGTCAMPAARRAGARADGFHSRGLRTWVPLPSRGTA